MTVALSDGTAFTGTTTHPIWSVDHADWRRIEDLLPGEQLWTLEGTLEVASVTALAEAQDVFNIEVEGEHVYRLLASGILVHNADYTAIIRNIHGILANYPKAIDPRTGRLIPFPTGLFSKPGTPANPLRWTDVERDAFKREWVERGFPVPAGGWSSVQIHHIHPREWGGNNDFWNLVPVEVTDVINRHTRFNRFWDTLRHVDNPFAP